MVFIFFRPRRKTKTLMKKDKYALPGMAPAPGLQQMGRDGASMYAAYNGYMPNGYPMMTADPNAYHQQMQQHMGALQGQYGQYMPATQSMHGQAMTTASYMNSNPSYSMSMASYGMPQTQHIKREAGTPQGSQLTQGRSSAGPNPGDLRDMISVYLPPGSDPNDPSAQQRLQQMQAAQAHYQVAASEGVNNTVPLTHM